jgi:hypothetical protein
MLTLPASRRRWRWWMRLGEGGGGNGIVVGNWDALVSGVRDVREVEYGA